MSEQTRCPNCGQPLTDDSVTCGRCGHRLGKSPGAPDPPEPAEPDIDAEELQVLAGESRRLHPLSPLVFAVTGVIVGLLAALAAGPELGVALGLLGGGLGVWALMRSGILR